MKLRKLLLATVGATVLLGALVSGASARNISVSNQFIESSFRRVTFRGDFGDIICEVHLSGSLHRRTLAKRVGSLIGYITQAELQRVRDPDGCEAGLATILRETLPWHVRYLGFNGALPNIRQIITNVIRAAFQVRQIFLCLATSTEANPAIGIFNRETATRVLTTATISGTIPTTCGVSGEFGSDEAPIVLLGTTNRITVTLI